MKADTSVTYAFRSNKIKSNGDPVFKYFTPTREVRSEAREKNEIKHNEAGGCEANCILVFDVESEGAQLSEKDQDVLVNTMAFKIRNIQRKRGYIKLIVLRLDMKLFEKNLNYGSGKNNTEDYYKHTAVFNRVCRDGRCNLFKNLKSEVPVVVMPLYGDDSCENDIMSINEDGKIGHLPFITSKDIMVKVKETHKSHGPCLVEEDLEYMINDINGSQDIIRYYLLPISLDFKYNQCLKYQLLKNICNWACMFQLMYLLIFDWLRATVVTMYVGGYKGKLWRHQDFTIIASRLVNKNIRKSDYSWYCAQWYFNGLPHGSYYNPKSLGSFSMLKKFIFMMNTNFFTYMTFIPLFVLFYFMATDKFFGFTSDLMDSWWKRQLADYIPTEMPEFTILNATYLQYGFFLIRDLFTTLFIFIFQTVVGLKYFIINVDGEKYLKGSGKNKKVKLESQPSDKTDEANTKEQKVDKGKLVWCITLVYFFLFPILSFSTVFVLVVVKLYQLVSSIYNSMVTKYNK